MKESLSSHDHNVDVIFMNITNRKIFSCSMNLFMLMDFGDPGGSWSWINLIQYPMYRKPSIYDACNKLRKIPYIEACLQKKSQLIKFQKV